MMNPKIKTAWTEALRSGRYEQGTDYLHRIPNDTFCCLGVLCDLAREHGIVRFEPRPRYEDVSIVLDPENPADSTNSELPIAVAKWAGLSVNPSVQYDIHVDPEGKVHPLHRSLAELNDSREWTFEAIADLIEEQL